MQAVRRVFLYGHGFNGVHPNSPNLRCQATKGLIFEIKHQTAEARNGQAVDKTGKPSFRRDLSGCVMAADAKGNL
jgi:hypothetical protein